MVFAWDQVIRVLGHAQIVLQVLFIHAKRLDAAFQRYGRLAAQGADTFLQPPHTGLSGIMRDDLLQRAVRDLKLSGTQRVLGHLFLHQMVLGDTELLRSGIGTKLNNLHTVKQRRSNGGGIIGSGDKQHLGQIHRKLNIMIGKGIVLLRVQRLQQCGGRVALNVVADLVNLVQQDNGVHTAAFDHCINNAAGHSADISLPVAANFCLIVDTAQGHPHILAVHGFCQGFDDRGFTYPGRACQTENLTGEVRVAPQHCQGLHNAVLHFVQAVMILIQHLAGTIQAHIVFGICTKRNFQALVQIIAHHSGLVGALGHFCQLVAFLEQMGFGFLIAAQLADLLPVAVRFLLGIILLAQRLRDHPHFLP